MRYSSREGIIFAAHTAPAENGAHFWTAQIIGSGWPAARFPEFRFLQLPGYDFSENVLQAAAGSKVLNVSQQAT